MAGVSVTVDVPVDPAFTLAALAPKVKVGCGVTVREIVALADRAPLVPFTVSV